MSTAQEKLTTRVFGALDRVWTTACWPLIGLLNLFFRPDPQTGNVALWKVGLWLAANAAVLYSAVDGLNKQPLFTAPPEDERLNPYAEIIVAEARRRGIGVRVLDAEAGYFRLSHGGVAIDCRESLSALTSAVAMSRCDDKRVTRRVLEGAGLRVPAQRLADELIIMPIHITNKRIPTGPQAGCQN
jgi:hypothetical protein